MRVVENAFGILACRWQIFYGTINCDLDLACSIVQACVVLHNYVQSDIQSANICDDYGDGKLVYGNWRNDRSSSTNFHSMDVCRYNRPSHAAQLYRDRLRDYFLRVGAVPWQWSM